MKLQLVGNPGHAFQKRPENPYSPPQAAKKSLPTDLGRGPGSNQPDLQMVSKRILNTHAALVQQENTGLQMPDAIARSVTERSKRDVDCYSQRFDWKPETTVVQALADLTSSESSHLKGAAVKLLGPHAIVAFLSSLDSSLLVGTAGQAISAIAIAGLVAGLASGAKDLLAAADNSDAIKSLKWWAESDRPRGVPDFFEGAGGYISRIPLRLFKATVAGVSAAAVGGIAGVVCSTILGGRQICDGVTNVVKDHSLSLSDKLLGSARATLSGAAKGVAYGANTFLAIAVQSADQAWQNESLADDTCLTMAWRAIVKSGA